MWSRFRETSNQSAEVVIITMTGGFMRLPRDNSKTSPVAESAEGARREKKPDEAVILRLFSSCFKGPLHSPEPRGEASLACFHAKKKKKNSCRWNRRLEAFSSHHLFCIFKSCSKLANLSRINEGKELRGKWLFSSHISLLLWFLWTERSTLRLENNTWDPPDYRNHFVVLFFTLSCLICSSRF